MTKETKIGLLVGLAFIIVIGILLSDHFTTVMQPPQAPLVNAAETVQESATTMGGTVSLPPPPVVDRVEPQRPIVTDTFADTGRIRIDFGPGESQVAINTDNSIQNTRELPPRLQIPETEPVQGPQNANSFQVSPEMPRFREHKAQAGDTVSKMAAVYLGSRSQANQNAIIALNPSLQENPNKVVIGAVYRVPAEAGAPAQTASNNAVPLPAPAPQPNTSTVTYTTRAGDSLWRIAVDQCGSASALSAIRELNKDVLKNGDTIKPNMTLRLPPRQIASAGTSGSVER